MTDTINYRINRYLSLCNIASRRKAEDLISAGKVTINGRTAVLSDTVDITKDIVLCDGKPVVVPSGHEYFLLNKPIDVLSSSTDDRGRKTVSDFLPKGSKAVPVGRLDLDTTGVLILTTDGELHYRLTHPSFEVKKVYKVKIAGDFDKKKADSIISGIEIEGFTMKAEKLSIINQKGKVTDALIVLNEGRKREIKELVKAVDCRVVRLERIAFGSITCDGLAPGDIRPLTQEEIKYLKKLTDLN